MREDDIATLVARQPQGVSLLQEFYADPDVFERDVERWHGDALVVENPYLAFARISQQFLATQPQMTE